MYLPIFNILGIGRERLRVDGKLTNCETGDRLVISKLLSKPIPRMLKIGKYIARELLGNPTT
jgi:hypothetical protein